MGIYITGYLLCINLAAFVVCAVDKKRSKRKGAWRVPEKTLFLLAALGGAAGLYVSMLQFRHKTRHKRFMIGVPLILGLQVVLAVWLFVRLGQG